MKTAILATAAALSLGLALPPANAADEEHSGHHASQSDKIHRGKGLVESVDLAKGVITMEHEPIQSLRWPRMVMDFKAHDPALLKGLKEGDRVEFDLVKMGKEYHITRIAPVR
ncbi:MAG TPA: copper-binding protein [Burkholderiales bacterium]|jgi:Cu/Ag efflux protein CusF|nr:copper-binding protein [Burkholderiales bacterium]